MHPLLHQELFRRPIFPRQRLHIMYFEDGNKVLVMLGSSDPCLEGKYLLIYVAAVWGRWAGVMIQRIQPHLTLIIW